MLKNAPVVKVQMLIRRSAAEVFAAFTDPAVTTKFWFTKSSGPLAPGAEVRWDWEMYGVGTNVRVKAFEPDRRLLVEWGHPPLPVEWVFTARPDGTTLVEISNRGFVGDDDDVVAQALDSKGGFTFVLAGLKAWLEHGVALNLVADHHPDANVQGGGA
jgi:uncharacterized protein YndB with AHSA1/START domain